MTLCVCVFVCVSACMHLIFFIRDCAVFPVYYNFRMESFCFSLPCTKRCCTHPLLFPVQPKIQSNHDNGVACLEFGAWVF